MGGGDGCSPVKPTRTFHLAGCNPFRECWHEPQGGADSFLNCFLSLQKRKNHTSFSRYDRSSLKVLGTVGEPINPEAWLWYYKVVGEERCSIVDTFWQTETVSPWQI